MLLQLQSTLVMSKTQCQIHKTRRNIDFVRNVVHYMANMLAQALGIESSVLWLLRGVETVWGSVDSPNLQTAGTGNLSLWLEVLV